jgi:hypothetical protein
MSDAPSAPPEAVIAYKDRLCTGRCGIPPCRPARGAQAPSLT